MRNHNTLVDMVFGETIQDPMFGTVLLNHKSSQRYWSSKVVFAPTQSEIALFFFNLDGTVPLEIKTFYRDFEHRYEDLKSRIEECLHRVYRQDITVIPRDEVWDIFALQSVTLPTAEEISQSNASWELDYSYGSSKAGAVFNVEFLNWEIVECYSGEESQ